MLTHAEIFAPSSLDDALKTLNAEKPTVLAGGTDLLVRIKGGLVPPPKRILLMDNIRSLNGIKKVGGNVVIGALTTFDDILGAKLLAEHAPHLQAAAYEIGSPQIRARATIGGNIVNASPAGDSLPPLYTLDAELVLRSVKGERRVKISDFFKGPGKTVKRKNELLIAIKFSIPNADSFFFFERIGTRKALAIAKISVSGKLDFDGDRISDATIALGAVGPTVLLSPSSRKELIGKPLSNEVMTVAASAAKKDCTPIDDIRSQADYRHEMVEVLIARGLGKRLTG